MRNKTYKARNDKPCIHCNQPEEYDKMVQCDDCDRWSHFECAGVNDSISEKPWLCKKCKSVQAEKFNESIVEEVEDIDRELVLIRREQALLARRSRLSQMRATNLPPQGTAPQPKPVPTNAGTTGTTFNNLYTGTVPKVSQHAGADNIKQPGEANSRGRPGLSKDIPQPRTTTNNPPPSASSTRVPQSTPHITFAKPPEDSSFLDYTGLNTRHMLSRNSIPKELPEFNGKPADWPLFYSSFVQSTNLCNYTEHENLLRLQKSLKGKAREYVQSLLALPSAVPDIMSTLEMVFGRVEYIIDDQMEMIRRTPPIKPDKLETIVTFAIAVKNLSATLLNANLSDHLSNPILLRDLVDRLPPNLKLEWANHKDMSEAFRKTKCDVRHFSEWLQRLSEKVCSVIRVYNHDETSSKSKNQKPENKSTKFSGPHAYEDQPQVNKDKDEKKCGICKERRHESLGDCKRFQELSLTKKWKAVRNFKVCRICLRNHRPYCDANTNLCGLDGCRESHHKTLHKYQAEKPSDSKSLTNFNGSHVPGREVICRIIPVTVCGGARSVDTFAFLDSGSTVTMVEDWVLDKIGVEGETDPLHLKWTGGMTRREEKSKRVDLKIKGSSNQANTYTLHARSVPSLDLPEQTLDVKYWQSKFEHLRGLPVQSYEEAKPAILIGLDNWGLVNPVQTYEGDSIGLVASKCRLGWTIEGPTMSTNEMTSLSTYTVGAHVCECYKGESLHELIKSYYEFDRLPAAIEADQYSMEDRRAKTILQDTVRKVGNNRYEAGLLWKYDSFELPDSRPLALKRLNCLEKKLRNSPNLKAEMDRQMHEYIEKGYVRQLTTGEKMNPPPRTWYVPLMAVINPKKPDRLRIVFDKAATANGISLNAMLLSGPDLTSSLLGVLIRFRLRKVGICGDVKEMFHQVLIRPEDQNVQRFLYKFAGESQIQEFILNVLSFGATCSPTIAQYVKNLSAEEHKINFPEAAAAVSRDTYVDDTLTSADDGVKAIKLANDITYVLSTAGFCIRNWRSNDQKVQEALEPASMVANQNVDVSGGEKIEKVLGMFWSTNDDYFKFSFKYNKGNEEILDGNKKATKRELLKIQMSLYDPLGLLANYIIQIKILIKDLWRNGSNWDEEVDDEQQQRFLKWLSHKSAVESLSIPRCYLTLHDNWDGVETQLHVLVDAGQDAYAAVAYLRLEKNSMVDCSLINAKSRVAPIKIVSIPRLELEAARLGARLAKSCKEMIGINIPSTVFWSDSDTVLAWLRSDAKSNPAFVAHRIAEIQDLTDIANWRYVPSSQNVADEASKRFDNLKLGSDSRWYRGPEFLRKPESEWPKKRTVPKVVEVVAKHHLAEPNWLIAKDRYSSWKKLVKMTAWLIRYRNKLQVRAKLKPPNNSEILTSDELREAETVLIRNAQHESYRDEINSLNESGVVSAQSKIAGMNPYIDTDGVLRSKSRLDLSEAVSEEVKRPIILPPRHWLTELIVRQFHEDLQHQNHETVINNLRERYWIPTLRQVLRRLRKNCVKCKLLAAKSTPPQMAPLPIGRVSVTRPFAHTGMDSWGPIYVTVGRTTQKRYGIIFTCLATRAVHLHVMHSLSTDSFIMALQTFISRRGRPQVLYSDNGTNFVGAERLLKEEMKTVEMKKVAEKFVSSDLEWRFNPPLSPHMGGSWERLIKSIKKALYATMPDHRHLNDESLISLLAMVENTINSRPLTYLPTDEAGVALTPNHFLRGGGDGENTTAPLTDDSNVLRNTWKRSEELATKFWRRWLKEYLPTLARRDKWLTPATPLQVNDIVYIIDENLPRNCWLKGRIISTRPGPDGQVRSVSVQTVNGIIDRSAHRLAKLEISTHQTAASKYVGENVRK